MNGEEILTITQSIQSLGETALLVAAILFGLVLTLVFLTLCSSERAKNKGYEIKKKAFYSTAPEFREPTPHHK